jgi:hypothetical protein
MGGKFSEAIKYFTLAEINTLNDEEIFQAKIENIKINILRRTTTYALTLLSELEKDTRFQNKMNEINYWRGWAYIFSDAWDIAANEFEKAGNQELKILTAEVHERKYSVTTAKILSYIIPGAGQFYTENYLSGVLSLGWNILFGYLTINSFIEERVVDGLIVGNLLWLRFYRGNIQNAERFAVEKNNKISNEALYFLQHSYKGEKP